MNQVKELCDLALEDPAPPLTPAAMVLDTARRTARRHTLYTATASGAALAVVVGLVFAVPALMHRPNATQQERPAPVAAATLPAVPGVDAAHDHSGEIARLLVGAVPPGYAAAVVINSSDGKPASTWRIGLSPHYVSATRVAVTLGMREGTLYAIIQAAGEQLGGDLCAAQAAAVLSRMVGAPETNCQVLTVNGVQVRVTSGQDPQRGAVIAAIRPLQGGWLAVLADQAVLNFAAENELPPDATGNGTAPSAKPGLQALPFTASQLAALATDPHMLP